MREGCPDAKGLASHEPSQLLFSLNRHCSVPTRQKESRVGRVVCHKTHFPAPSLPHPTLFPPCGHLSLQLQFHETTQARNEECLRDMFILEVGKQPRNRQPRNSPGSPSKSVTRLGYRTRTAQALPTAPAERKPLAFQVTEPRTGPDQGQPIPRLAGHLRAGLVGGLPKYHARPSRFFLSAVPMGSREIAGA